MFRAFKLIGMVHPMGEVLITVTEYNKIRAIRADTGEVLDTLEPGLGNVLCLRTCSSLPVIVFGNDHGIVYLYSLFSGTEFSRMTAFNLSDFGIIDMHINYRATHIVVLDESNGLFVISVSVTIYF